MQKNQPNVRMMGQSLIIVDLDGTLLDDRERHYRCYCDIITLLGGKPLISDEYIALKRTKMPLEKILSLSKLGAFVSRFSKMFLERIESKEYLAYEFIRPDALEFMSDITQMGLKLMLATMRKNNENLLWQLQRLGIYSYFEDRILCGSKREVSKNSLVPWRVQCVVGDTEDDEAMADILETVFFGILSGMRDKRFLHADYYVDNLNEIPSILQTVWGSNNGKKKYQNS